MINNELFNYVKEFQKGNKQVFEQIYNATNNQLFNVIYSIAKDKELAYDLVQETYITFYTKAESINNPESIQKWLTIVAINKVKRYLQTKNKDILVAEDNKNLFENQEELDEEFLPQEILDNKEKQKIILDYEDDIWNEEARNDDNTYEYIGFKEMGDENIESVSVSDSSIIEATINKEGKYILIKQNGVVGTSLVTTTNDKGEFGNIEIECSQYSDGKIHFSNTSIY